MEQTAPPQLRNPGDNVWIPEGKWLLESGCGSSPFAVGLQVFKVKDDFLAVTETGVQWAQFPGLSCAYTFIHIRLL